MSADYWLGVATPFVVAAVLCLAFAGWVRGTMALERIGITFEAKGRRRLDRISDYVLQNNIWWERAFGPIFVGGWYREKGYEKTTGHVNRWVGIGLRRGPCVMVFKSRDLGPTA